MAGAGQKRAAPAALKPAPVPTGLHAFVVSEFFSVALNGQILSFQRNQRYVVDEATRTVIAATSADVTWES
jgi:hypothetical protein